MTTNYYYSAYCYLDEWLEFDRHAILTLCSTEGESESQSQREELVAIAKHYGVIRSFRPSDEPMRLAEAWDELKRIDKPKDADDATKCVEELVGALKLHYHIDLLSAASKFLWMRFQTPIIIYDSLAWEWICKHRRGLKVQTYSDYCDVWRLRFEEHEGAIKEAASKLLNIRQFLRPNNIAESELEKVVASAWFTERVFDHFICNDR